MGHSRNAVRRHVAHCILQFIMSTLQVAAFAIAAPGRQGPWAEDACHKRCFKLRSELLWRGFRDSLDQIEDLSSVNPVGPDVRPIPLVISGLNVQFFTNGGVTPCVQNGASRPPTQTRF
jgi:hypothetical protein